MNEPMCCANCKHWKRVVGESDNDETFRVQNLLVRDGNLEVADPQPFSIGKCVNRLITANERPVNPMTATVVDGSDFFAALVTAEGFSCSLHERS